MNSKIVFAILGLATLVATPAFAQKQAHRATSAAYASAVEPQTQIQSWGRAVGTDPDPSIRFELQRDSTTYTTSN